MKVVKMVTVRQKGKKAVEVEEKVAEVLVRVHKWQEVEKKYSNPGRSLNRGRSF